MWGAVSGASAAIGPIVGGLLTEGISWRWIFFVNLPVSVLAIVLCLTALEDAHATVKARIDLVGMVTFTAAAGTLTYGLIKANEDGWAAAASWGCLIASAVLFVSFVLVERAVRQPMLDLSLMRNRAFVGVLVAGLVLTLSAFSAFTYTSIWLQSVLGLSPIEAGLTGLPLSASAFIVSAAIGRFLHGSRSGPIIGGGMLFIGAGGMVGALLVQGSASWPALVPGFLLMGVGVGLATPTLGSTAMAAVPMQRGGMAAGAVNTARQLGFALGIAALGSVFAAKAGSVLSDRGVPQSGRVAKALAGGQAKYLLDAVPARFHDALDSALHAAAVSGLQLAFLVSGIAGLVFGAVCWRLLRAPRAIPRPRRPRRLRRPADAGAGRRRRSGGKGHGHSPHERGECPGLFVGQAQHVDGVGNAHHEPVGGHGGRGGEHQRSRTGRADGRAGLRSRSRCGDPRNPTRQASGARRPGCRASPRAARAADRSPAADGFPRPSAAGSPRPSLRGRR